MDQMMIDLSAFKEGEVRPGVPVILIGSSGDEQITMEELAGRELPDLISPKAEPHGQIRNCSWENNLCCPRR